MLRGPVICVLDPFAFNGGNTSNSLIYFSKVILKRHTDNSLEVHENDPSSRLFCCWLLGKVDASNRCLGGCHFLQIVKCPQQS